MAQSKVYLKVDRVSADVCAHAAQASVSDLHEAMGRPACQMQTMSPAMRSLLEGVRIAGPAITAFCPPGDNLMMHRALYLGQKGDVLVVASPEAGAQWGDVAAYYALRKGLAGVVVDGYIRDVDELRAMRSPVWATKIGPSSPQKAGHGLVNAPIVCAGVARGARRSRRGRWGWRHRAAEARCRRDRRARVGAHASRSGPARRDRCRRTPVAHARGRGELREDGHRRDRPSLEA